MIVFSKEWFEKYNKLICKLANSFIGEFVFKFSKFGHYLDKDKKIVRITPNSVAQLVGVKGDKVEIKEQFFGRNEYALRLKKVFYPIWLTFHAWDIVTRPIPQLNLGFDTLTVYPDAGSGTGVAVDGFVERNDKTVWADARDATTGNNVNNNAVYLLINSNYRLNETYPIIRAVTCFDTSSLTSSASISAAELSLAGRGYGVADTTSTSLEVVSATIEDTEELALADFDQFGSTSFASIAFSSWTDTDGTYNNLTLNASGRSNISLTSVSQFGYRTGRDLDDEAPTPKGNNELFFISADEGTTKPKLVITYTIVDTATNFLLMF